MLIGASVVKRSANAPQGGLNVTVKDSAGGALDTANTFVASPLPLGWTYRIVSHRGRTYLFSEEVTLTETAPTREITMRFPKKLIDQVIEVIDPDGKPISGTEVNLSLQATGGSYGSQPFPTGRDGRVVFEGLNTEQPKDVKHTLDIKPLRDFQFTRKEFQPSDKPVRIQIERGHAISGRAIDNATGQPIANLEVYANGAWKDAWKDYPSNLIDSDARTDDQGRFRFTRLSER